MKKAKYQLWRNTREIIAENENVAEMKAENVNIWQYQRWKRNQ